MLVQYVVSKNTGSATATLTFPATPTVGNQIIVASTGGSGSTPTAFSITDNQVGNSYNSIAVAGADGVGRTAQIALCSAIAGSAGAFAITVTAGTGQNCCDIVAMEWSGVVAQDQKGVTSSYTASQTSLTLAATGKNTGSADIVIVAYVSAYNSNAALGLQNPSGYTLLDLSDPGLVGNSCSIAYRAEGTGLTDSVTWNWTTSANTGAAAIASFIANGTLQGERFASPSVNCPF